MRRDAGTIARIPFDKYIYFYKGLKITATQQVRCRFFFFSFFRFSFWRVFAVCRNCAPILRVAVNSRYCSSGSNCCRRVILIRRRFIERKRSTFCVSRFNFFRSCRASNENCFQHCPSIGRMNICRLFCSHSDSKNVAIFFFVFAAPTVTTKLNSSLFVRGRFADKMSSYEKKKMRSSLAKNKQLKCLKSFTYSACFHSK